MKAQVVTSVRKSTSSHSRSPHPIKCSARNHYSRNHAYSPTLQRWMQQDPAGYIDGLNMYQPVADNPINETDPTGLAGAFPTPAQQAANRIAMLNAEKSYLIGTIASFKSDGYICAADMLTHFLDNTGTPYTLSAADDDEIKHNVDFQYALWGDIAAKYPLSMRTNVNGTYHVDNSFRPYFYPGIGNNGLFYAFGSANVSYKGTITRCGKSRKYDLTITFVKPLYNFTPKTPTTPHGHGAIDYYFQSFASSWILQNAGWAKPFTASGTFQMKS